MRSLLFADDSKKDSHVHVSLMVSKDFREVDNGYRCQSDVTLKMKTSLSVRVGFWKLQFLCNGYGGGSLLYS